MSKSQKIRLLLLFLQKESKILLKS